MGPGPFREKSELEMRVCTAPATNFQSDSRENA